MTNNKQEYIFREVDGIWRRVDSQEPEPPTLAEFMKSIFITIDDDTQFCRIIRYGHKCRQTIIYRAYTGAKVRITIHMQYE